MDKKEFENIIKNIELACGAGSEMSNHGNWVCHLATQVAAGETPVLSEEDSGLDFFGLEPWIKFE